MKRLPYALILFRLAAGITFLPLTLCHAPSAWLVVVLAAGVSSDIVDGMAARRLGVATLALRRLDTRADLIFYGCAVAAALARNPVPASGLLPWLVAYFALFVARNLVDYFRYRASPSYHMWSGKLWSAVIALHLGTLFLGMHVPVLLPMAFVLYAINALEGIVASSLLKHPCQDVPSIWHVFTSDIASPHTAS